MTSAEGRDPIKRLPVPAPVVHRAVYGAGPSQIAPHVDLPQAAIGGWGAPPVPLPQAAGIAGWDGTVAGAGAPAGGGGGGGGGGAPAAPAIDFNALLAMLLANKDQASGSIKAAMDAFEAHLSQLGGQASAAASTADSQLQQQAGRAQQAQATANGYIGNDLAQQGGNGRAVAAQGAANAAMLSQQAMLQQQLSTRLGQNTQQGLNDQHAAGALVNQGANNDLAQNYMMMKSELEQARAGGSGGGGGGGGGGYRSGGSSSAGTTTDIQRLLDAMSDQETSKNPYVGAENFLAQELGSFQDTPDSIKTGIFGIPIGVQHGASSSGLEKAYKTVLYGYAGGNVGKAAQMSQRLPSSPYRSALQRIFQNALARPTTQTSTVSSRTSTGYNASRKTSGFPAAPSGGGSIGRLF